MVLHIRIKNVVDFYVGLSRKNPIGRHRATVDEQIKVNDQALLKEDLNIILDRVNMWIGNCDQKASFILAIIGVGLTVACSGDFMKYVWAHIIKPVKAMCTNNMEINCIVMCMALLLFLITLSMVASILQMIYALRAKIDLSKFSQEGMQSNSMLHYQTIAKRTYQEFCKDEVHMLNDLRTQVYVNSVICTSKFSHYKKGVRLFELSIFLWLIFIVLLLIA